MSLFFLITYLFFDFIRLPEMYAALRPLHIMVIIGIGGCLAGLGGCIMNPKVALQKQTFLVIIFMGVIAASRVFSGWTGGAVYALEDFSVMFAMYLMIAGSVTNLKHIKVVWGLTAALSMVLVVFGILALHGDFFSETFVMREAIEVGGLLTGEFDRRIRGLGALNDPNDFAQVLLVAIVGLGMFWKKRSFFRNVLFLGPPAAFLVYGVYLSKSRGALIGLVAIGLLGVRERLGRVGSLMTAGLLCAVLLAANFGGGRAFSSSEDSAHSRLTFWGEGMQMLRSHPVFGVGYKNYADENEGRAAHNSFIQCAAELGLPGYMVWLSLIVVTVRGLSAIQRLPEKDPEVENLRRCAKVIRVALWVFLITGWFLSRAYAETLYMLLALGMVVTGLAKQAGQKPQEDSILALSIRTGLVAMCTLVLLKVMIRFG